MRRYRFSIRGLMVLTAVLALLLVPVVWVAREREQVLRAREEALRAVVLAERHRRAVVLAQQIDKKPAFRPAVGLPEPADAPPQSSDVSALIERLQRENAALKETVVRLRSEVERLKAAAERQTRDIDKEN
jgi:hypothetical protein